jgi:hypothetical protein
MRLYWSVLAVAALLLAVGLATSNVAQFGWLKGVGDVAIGLAANLVAAVLVALLVERVLEKRQRLDERRRRTVALRQLQRRLTQHLNMLAMLHVAASEYRPHQPSFSELLGDEMLLAFKNLDFLRPLPPLGTALRYFAVELARLREALDTTVAKYAAVLDTATLTTIERLSQASLIEFIIDNDRWVQQGSADVSDDPALLRNQTAEPMVRAYLGALRYLVERYDAVVPESARLLESRPDHTFIAHGAGRLASDTPGVIVGALPDVDSAVWL